MKELDKQVAEAIGLELITIGYFGTDDETEWQVENEDWLNDVGLNYVGDYWVSIPLNKWYSASPNQTEEEFTPSTNYNQGMPLLEEKGIMTAKFEHREGVSCESYWIGAWTHPVDSMHYRHKEEGATLLEAGLRALVASLTWNKQCTS